MADYWLLEKQLVHKLFKVLVPRFENYNTSYTRMFRAPREFPGRQNARSILELKENPYPTLNPDVERNKLWINNILLDGARQDKHFEFRKSQKESKAHEEIEEPKE